MSEPRTFHSYEEIFSFYLEQHREPGQPEECCDFLCHGGRWPSCSIPRHSREVLERKRPWA